MTTKQLFHHIQEIYQDKKLLKTVWESHDIIISSHDNYYECSYRKGDIQIKFKIEVEMGYPEYTLHYRIISTENTLEMPMFIPVINKTITNTTIPEIISNLLVPIIREIKINNIIE
jgi:hypothetical protein